MISLPHNVFPWPVRARCGQSMVEFAIGLPVLLTLLLGFIEVSQLVLAYIVVGQTAHEAARYAITTTVSTPPTWAQQCNRGLDISISPGYEQYNATESACVGWTNVVSTVASKSPGIRLATTRIRISYQRTPPPASGQLGLEGYNRSVPLTVTVLYDHQPLTASFLRLPTTITLQGAATMVTQ